MIADIFIPTSNRIDALSQCLESLARQTTKKFKAYLVGQEKNLAVEALVKKHQDIEIEYFIQTKEGLIGAANEALARAENEIFIRIDDDVVLDAEWLENVLDTFASDEKIGGVTGPAIISAEGIRARDLNFFLDKFNRSVNPILKLLNFIYGDYLYEGRMFEVGKFLRSGVFTLGANYENCLKKAGWEQVDNLEACNWAVRRDGLERIGGFDEIFLKGLGDYHESDAGYKIKKLGYKLVFNPKARLRHNVETGKVPKARPAAYYRIQNLFIFYSRHIGFRAPSYFFRFWTNVLCQNGYYLFRFFTTGKIHLLGALPGTLVGAIRYFTTEK